MYKGVIMALDEVELKLKNNDSMMKEHQFYMIQGLNVAKQIIEQTYDFSVIEIPNETLEDLIADIITEHGSDLAIETLGYIIDELKEIHSYELDDE